MNKKWHLLASGITAAVVLYVGCDAAIRYQSQKEQPPDQQAALLTAEQTKSVKFFDAQQASTESVAAQSMDVQPDPTGFMLITNDPLFTTQPTQNIEDQFDRSSITPPKTQLRPFNSLSFDIQPDEQIDLTVKPDSSRDHTFSTFGDYNTMMALFEYTDGRMKYIAGNDDNNELDQNARFTTALTRGHTYILMTKLKFVDDVAAATAAVQREIQATSQAIDDAQTSIDNLLKHTSPTANNVSAGHIDVLMW